MKRLYTIIISVLLALGLTGCSQAGWPVRGYRPIENLRLVRTIGFDQTAEGHIRFSISTGKSVEGKKATRLSASGETVTQAMDRVQDFSDSRQLYYPHVGHILLGERAADDMARCLDFFERSSDIRLDTKVLVVRGAAASRLIMDAGGEESDITDILGSFDNDMEQRGDVKLTTLNDVALGLSENGAALCVAVEPVANTGGGEGETLLPAGYAIIKDGALAGYITGENTRGVALLLGETGSGAIQLPENGATVRLTKGGVKMSPIEEDGRLAGLKFEVEVSAALAELDEPSSFNGGDDLHKIAMELASKMRGWVEFVLQAEAESEADFMGFGRGLAVKRPGLWAGVSDSWPEALSTLRFEVDSTATVERSYDIDQPVSAGGGGQ